MLFLTLHDRTVEIGMSSAAARAVKLGNRASISQKLRHPCADGEARSPINRTMLAQSKKCQPSTKCPIDERDNLFIISRMSRSPKRSDQARRIDVVEPGLYRLALVRNGWKVPCRIYHEDFVWWVEIDQEHSGYNVTDPFECPKIVHVHEWGEKISDRQYDWLIAIKGWAAMHDPDHPCLQPWTSMDPMNLRPLIPRRSEWTPE